MILLIEYLEVRHRPINLFAWVIKYVFAALKHSGALRFPHVCTIIETEVFTVLRCGRLIIKRVHVPFVAICHVEKLAQAREGFQW